MYWIFFMSKIEVTINIHLEPSVKNCYGIDLFIHDHLYLCCRLVFLFIFVANSYHLLNGYELLEFSWNLHRHHSCDDLIEYLDFGIFMFLPHCSYAHVGIYWSNKHNRLIILGQAHSNKSKLSKMTNRIVWTI